MKLFDKLKGLFKRVPDPIQDPPASEALVLEPKQSKPRKPKAVKPNPEPVPVKAPVIGANILSLKEHNQ